jgi:aspartyl-tRNA(Asn)/glutamyl-tRNA(Gln) amidotransferase subunit A
VPDYLAEIDAGVDGKRIGVADAYLRHHVDPTVRRLVEEGVATLERLGGTVVEISPPPPSEAVPALLAMLMPEATAYHLPWLRERPQYYSPSVRERLELGAVTPAVSYIQAQQVRRRFTDAFLRAMDGVDILVTPSGPTAATPLEGDLITGDDADPEVLAALITFSGPFSI